MTSMRKHSLLSIALGMTLVPSLAQAADPLHAELAAKAGFGTNPLPNAPNPLAFGVGGRAVRF